MAESRRSSILKPPKQRAPLQEVSSLNIHNHDDFTATTFTQNIMRRVSFAGTSTVKEFDTRAESVLVCHTPAYEESFATSDSSVPSDHSSRFSSRSTISIEDQSTLPPCQDGASVEPEDLVQPEKTQSQNVVPEDPDFEGMLKEFGVEPVSQRKKSPSRRPRFSIAGPSDEEDSPVTKEKPPVAPVPSSLFYGNPSPKTRPSAIPSPRSQRMTIDPFTLRPKLVNSPKSQSKRKSLAPPARSPKGKSPAAKSLFNPNNSASSEMDLTEGISGNIFVNTPSPSSVDSQSTPGSVHTPLRSANRTVVSQEDMEFTHIGQRTPGWKNKTVYDNDMDITRAIPTSIHSSDGARVQFSDGQVHCSVQNSMTMQFPRPVSSVAVTNEQHFVTDGHRGVICMSKSHMTALPVPREAAADDLAVFKSSGYPQRNENRTDFLNKSSNTTVCDAVGMDFTSVPSANKTLNTSMGMDFTEVIPSIPARLRPPVNATVGDLEGMEFTQSHPVSDKEFERVHTNNLNQTLNESMGMDFTEAIPSVPIVQENCFSEPIPPVSREVQISNNTLNVSMGVEFTEAIPSEPVAQDFVASNETSDSTAMEFTKAIPCMPIVQEVRILPETVPVSHQICDSILNRTEPRLSVELPTIRSNTTVCDSAGMEITKADLSPPLDNSEISKTSQVVSEGTKTPDSVATAESLMTNRSQPSLQPVTVSFQQTENLESSKLQAPDQIGASEVDSNLSRTCDTRASDSVVSSSSAQPTTPLKLQLCRKRSFDEVEKTEQDELAPRKSRLMASPLLPAPTEIVIPSSRSPSPEEHDSSTRFPGLSQSFSKTLNLSKADSRAAETSESDPAKTVCENTCNPQADEEVNSSPSVSGVIISTNCPPVENPTNLETPPINEAATSVNETDTPISTIDAPISTIDTPVSTTDTPISTIDTAMSTASEGVVRAFHTPDEYNFTDISDKTKSSSVEKSLHKSIMDESIPSIVDISDACADRDVSSDARLCAALLEAQNNVSVFHKESDVEVPSDESMRGEVQETENRGDQEGNMSVCEEREDVIEEQREDTTGEQRQDVIEKQRENAIEKQRQDVIGEQRQDVIGEQRQDVIGEQRQDVIGEQHQDVIGEQREDVIEEQRQDVIEEQRQDVIEEQRQDVIEEQRGELSGGSGAQSRDLRSLRSLPSPTLIPSDSPKDTRASSIDKVAAGGPGTSRRAFGVQRPLDEIFKEHRSQYRKRARCNWTVRKSKDSEWCFNYLEDSVELRIKVKESRSGAISGRDGHIVSLITDDLDGIWYIGGRLLYQKLSTIEWTSRIPETSDVLSLVEDINVVANDVEVFMTHLAHLKLLKNVEVTHDWMRFDVTSKKTLRWFKVKVDCRDICNIKPQNVTTEDFIGETREADIQNLVTCVKKNASFLKNYVEVVKEYVETIERLE